MKGVAPRSAVEPSDSVSGDLRFAELGRYFGTVFLGARSSDRDRFGWPSWVPRDLLESSVVDGGGGRVDATRFAGWRCSEAWEARGAPSGGVSRALTARL